LVKSSTNSTTPVEIVTFGFMRLIYVE